MPFEVDPTNVPSTSPTTNFTQPQQSGGNFQGVSPQFVIGVGLVLIETARPGTTVQVGEAIHDTAISALSTLADNVQKGYNAVSNQLIGDTTAKPLIGDGKWR